MIKPVKQFLNRPGRLLGCIFLLLLAGSARAQDTLQTTYRLSQDSLEHVFVDLPQWRFQPGDNPAWAAPHFDDAAWPVVSATLPMPTMEQKGFKGMGWLRCRLLSDSTVSNLPLAITMYQQGASQVFLDGRLLDSFGHIGDAKTSRYYDPNEEPFYFNLAVPGEHVLAVRFANYEAARNLRKYEQDMAGFKMQLSSASLAVYNFQSSQSNGLVVSVFLFGLFLALFILHLLLFAYNRRQGAHLLFALLAASLAAIPVTLYWISFTNDPAVVNRIGPFFMLLTLVAALLLSSFLNITYPRKRPWLFYIVCVLAACMAVLAFFAEEVANGLLTIFTGLIAVEAVFITGQAVYRRKPGARILGAGFILFALFLLLLLGLGISGTGISIKHGTWQAYLGLFVAFLVVLAIPISISAYLAWGVSRTNKDLAGRLDEVAALSQKSLEQEAEKQRILEQQNEVLESEVAARTNDLRRQKQRSDDLLLNILPAEVAEELKEKGSSEARHYHEVSVLFTDFVNFTSVAERLSPQALVTELNTCFTAFDAIMERHGLEKIKTIGDAYMAVCGLPIDDPRHAQHCVQAALEIRDYVRTRLMAQPSHGPDGFDVRIGVHSGSVVAGIIGVKKFAYDVWGDAVNMAARMEQSSEAGRVNISEATHQLVKDEFACEPRGRIAAKNKGEIEMFFVEPLPT